MTTSIQKSKQTPVSNISAASLTLFAAMEKITPERALQLLEKNTNNRMVSRANVNFIKKQLIEGKWMLNGECIKIAADGEILDGQHRLIACHESGIPLETMIMFNVGKEAKHTMDTGRNRSASDVLSFVFPDKKYIGAITSAAKFVIAFNKGMYGMASTNSGENKNYGSDNTDIMNFVQNTEGFIAFVEKSHKMRNNGDSIMDPRLFIGLHWILSQKYAAPIADKFFSILSTGMGISDQETDPIFVLRKKLLAAKLKNSKDFRFTPTEVMWGVVKAFTYYISGKKTKQMQLDGQPVEF